MLVFGRMIPCLLTQKLFGRAKDTNAINYALISSTRENTHLFALKRGILVRTMAGGTNIIKSRSQNRLSLEKSPYLLQHAGNPVDWFPWGEEAFEKARREDKIIFLSVGYSTCHWCHVMERECFERADIARVMNEHFVSVKVDREERPDVDRIYMTFVQVTSGGGGWPMSVWLTPDLLPLFGGTYFPPEDDATSDRPGFRTLLQIIQRQWREDRTHLMASATRVAEILRRIATASNTTGSTSSMKPPGPSCADSCLRTLSATFDPEWGGFGGAPKFPQAPLLEFLLHEHARAATSDDGQRALCMVMTTLRAMIRGGIHDHLGGGFARYSTDGHWHVPHFEKMLYDQAQLASVLSGAWLATRDMSMATALRALLAYVARDLSHPEGGFFSAEDADSLPPAASPGDAPAQEGALREGAFYVWTEDEVRTVLAETQETAQEESLADLFCRTYDVCPGGNVSPAQDPHGELRDRNVLRLPPPKEPAPNVDDERLAEARRRLLQARGHRPRPLLDHKIITAWNGLMVSGFARAGEALADAALVARAVAAARFVRTHLRSPSGGLLHCAYGTPGGGSGVDSGSQPIEGFLSDYAFFIRGLLDLYEASLQPEWLAWAEQLQELQDKLFWDEENGGYFTTASAHSSLLFRSKEDSDGAEPSAAGVTAVSLQRLAALLGRDDLSARARALLTASAPSLVRRAASSPTLCVAARLLADGLVSVVVSGPASDAATAALLEAIRGRPVPGRALALADAANPLEAGPNARRDQLRRMAARPARAYVCRRKTCSLPVDDAAALARLLDPERSPSPNTSPSSSPKLSPTTSSSSSPKPSSPERN